MNLARVYDLLAPLYRLFLDLCLKREQEAALGYVTGQRILDLGCGTGYLLSRMYNGKRKLYGLDFSQGMLRQAKIRLEREQKNAVLIQGDYASLPFPDESFDSVVVTFSLSYAPDILPVFLKIHRVLKKNGRLVIVDVGPASRFSPGAMILLNLYRLEADHPRDETKELHRVGFRILLRKELSRFGTVHLVVAQK